MGSIPAAAFLVALSITTALTPVPVLAQAAAPSVAAAAAQGQSNAQSFIQDLGNQAISVMADKGESPDQRTQKYRQILQTSFDMPTIGHFVLGRAWNTATPQQQQEFMQLFQQIVLKTYGDRLNFYSGEGFKVTGQRQEDAKDTVVSSQVTHTDGSPPTKVEWRVRDMGGKSGIVDVSVEGVSQSVTQRDEYASIIQRNGGNIDGLLKLMRQRAQESGQGLGSTEQ